MLVKTSELSGVALDYAVAKCEGATNLHYDTIATWWQHDGNEQSHTMATRCQCHCKR